MTMLQGEGLTPQAVLDDLFVEDGLLGDRLRICAREHGVTNAEADELLSHVPIRLMDTPAFFNRLTQQWCFGLPGRDPYQLSGSGKLLWGTHMWPLVETLFRVLRVACARLGGRELRDYIARLNDSGKHWAALAEFMPMLRLPDTVPARNEQPTGAGNRTADWLIDPGSSQPVWCEVKHREFDIVAHAERIVAARTRGEIPEPDHDAAMLFRNLDEKFPERDPDSALQGVWIMPTICQPRADLQSAFEALNTAKVHFAIIGSWEPGIWLLTRRQQDRERLLTLFQETEDSRHVF